MIRYSEDTIQRVLSATNVVDLVGAYIPLKRAGKDYRTNCPFHNEKTPSFYVTPSKQSYHCFGCGAGGTALRFIMEYENVDFRTALKKLADRAGILLPEEDTVDPEAENLRRRRTRLLTVLGEAAKFFHHQLLTAPDAQSARDYLKNRGFDRQTALNWQIGYAPEAFNRLADWAKSQKFSARDLIDTGLATLRDENRPQAGLYARFRHRLMFPIHNDYGDVIAFSGRVLDPDSKLAKYINSPETPVFHKGSVLFGMHRAKRPILKAKSALICEGQMDLIALAEAGLDHAIAPLGTALTPEHAKMLKRHTDVVVLCYDGDAAGWKAADRAFSELASAGLEVKVTELPPGEDPDSLLRKEGADALRARLAAATPYMDFFFARRAAALNGDDTAAHNAVAHDAAAVVSRYTDPMARENVLRRAAIRLAIDPEVFRRAVRRELSKQQAQDRLGPSNAPEQTPSAPTESTPQDRALYTLLHLALLSKETRALLNGPEGAACLALPGTEKLRHLLTTNPDPHEPSRMNAFLATLDADEEARLQALLARPAPPDPVKAARDCLAKIAEIQRRDHHRRVHVAKLEDKNTEIGEILRTLAEIQQKVVDRGKPVQQDAPLSSATIPAEPIDTGDSEDPF